MYDLSIQSLLLISKLKEWKLIYSPYCFNIDDISCMINNLKQEKLQSFITSKGLCSLVGEYIYLWLSSIIRDTWGLYCSYLFKFYFTNNCLRLQMSKRCDFPFSSKFQQNIRIRVLDPVIQLAILSLSLSLCTLGYRVELWLLVITYFSVWSLRKKAFFVQ